MKDSIKKKYTERLSELITEGKQYYMYHKKSASDDKILDPDLTENLVAWQVRVKNIIFLAFGKSSIHYRFLTEETTNTILKVSDLQTYVGLITGALKDLEDGFINGIETLVSADVLDSVLQEAKELNQKGYKDPAAVLGRVVLEKSLQKLAEVNKINSAQKASELNNQLKSNKLYNKAQWRLIQSRLDLGNHAAHGEFEEYSHSDVKDLIKDIENFISNYLTES